MCLTEQQIVLTACYLDKYNCAPLVHCAEITKSLTCPPPSLRSRATNTYYAKQKHLRLYMCLLSCCTYLNCLQVIRLIYGLS